MKELFKATSTNGRWGLIIVGPDDYKTEHAKREGLIYWRDTPIVMHYLLVRGGVSEKVYRTVGEGNRNFVARMYFRS